MKTTELRPMACPVCGYVMEFHSSIFEDALPKEGDFTICIRCEAVLRYGKDYELLEGTINDFEKLRREDPKAFKELQEVRTALKQVNIAHPRKDWPPKK